jgi:acyl carrier protein
MQGSMDIEREIRAFLEKNFPLYEEAKVGRDDSLVESGAIDSLGILELVDFVEERFQLRIPEDELLPENLDSIGNITRYLEHKRGAGSVVRNEAGSS